MGEIIYSLHDLKVGEKIEVSCFKDDHSGIREWIPAVVVQHNWKYGKKVLIVIMEHGFRIVGFPRYVRRAIGVGCARV